MESVDHKDVVLHFDTIEKDNTKHEHTFYRKIAKTVKDLHKDNDDIELIQGFVVYKATKKIYYNQVLNYKYNRFWPYKTTADRLLVTNHIYGNIPLSLTGDMKGALTTLDNKIF